MKKVLFLCAFLFSIQDVAYSQYAYYAYKKADTTFNEGVHYKILQMQSENPADTGEGSDLNAFVRWGEFMDNRICADAPIGTNITAPINSAMIHYLDNMNSYCTSSSSKFSGDWKCMGPFNHYLNDTNGTEFQGRLNCLWIDPTDENHILAGAEQGGLWKTTNGGLSWHNITDASNGIVPGTMGIGCIAVDPTNSDRIYISLYVTDVINQVGYGYNLGLAYSTDGGATWQRDDDFNNMAGAGPFLPNPITKIAFLPGTEHLYAIVKNAIVWKDSPSASWGNITPSSDLNTYSDIEFSKYSPGKLIFSTMAFSNSSNLWVLDYSTGTYTKIAITLPSNYYQVDDGDGIIDISISGQDTAYILMVARRTSDNSVLKLLLKNSLTSSYPILICEMDTAIAYTSETNIEVSGSNKNVIYAVSHTNYSGQDFYQSNDEGHHFDNNITGILHGDGRFITIYKDTTTADGIDDIVFGTTDGGVGKKSRGDYHFHSITGDSLCVTEFYGLSTTEADGNILSGGAQDNGGFSFIKNRIPAWIHQVDGDNYLTEFKRNGDKTSWGDQNAPKFYTIAFSGNTSTLTATIDVPSADFCSVYPSDPCQNWLRPLYVDQNNNAFAGIYNIWKMQNGSSTWQRAFSKDPKETFSDLDLKKVRKFIISEKNPDTVYIAYQHPGTYDPTDAGWSDTGINPWGRLYRSFNSGDTINPVTWTNITPYLVLYNRINDIETDPLHINRIWVVLGDANWDLLYTPADSMGRKVLYSDDFGDTWVDVSHGLPPLPINSIVYQKGSNDILFVGTDVGVFRCDFSKYNPTDMDTRRNVNKSVSWECFNNGFPTCIITGMEINYCAKKLRVSTYGRGIWESDIEDPNIHFAAPNFTERITTNTTWSQPMWITGNIKVETGAKLTIDRTTIHMPKNGRIAVDKGATLIVDSSIITNDCDTCFWEGIEAWGDTSHIQNTAHKGTVIVKNHSVLQHATYAVSNWNLAEGPRGGGIIQCTKSTFLNNRISAKFNQYEARIIGKPINDQSFFQDCLFMTDHNYKGTSTNQPFIADIDMYTVRGVHIMGCDFKNLLHYGKAINSYASGFVVGQYEPGPSYCSPSYAPCGKRSSFSGYNYAIDVEGGINSNGASVSIDLADFDTSTIGVYVSAYDNVATTRCNFNVGKGPNEIQILGDAPCYENIGIYEKRSVGFAIEENAFAGTDTTIATYGVVIQNAFKLPTRVYKNSFDALQYACMGIDSNFAMVSASGVGGGLQFLCNTYSNNKNDIYVLASDPTKDYETIGNQGSSGHPTGNVFSTGPGILVNTNVKTALAYYYFSAPGVTDQELAPPFTHVYPALTSPPSTCASTYGDNAPGGSSGYNLAVMSPSGMSTLSTDMLTYKSAWQSALTTYTTKLDGGNTGSLIGYINSRAPGDSTALQILLLSYSPYLSEAVLKAVGDGTKLPYAKYMSVLEANPEVLRSDIFLKYINHNLPVNITSQDIETLKGYREPESARGITEDSIRHFYSEMANNAALLLRSMNTDTAFTYPTVDTNSTDAQIDTTRVVYFIDSIITVLNNIGDLGAEYGKAGYYYARGDLSTAESIINNIPTGYSLSTSQSDEYADYASVWAILDTLALHDKTIYDMDSASLATIKGLEQGIGINYGRMLASNIISALLSSAKLTETLGPGPFTDRVICPYNRIGSPKPSGQNPGENGQLKELKNLVKAFPNPAKEKVTFSYTLPITTGTVFLEITDIVGRQVVKYTIGDKQGQISWNTDGAPDGIYIYKVRDSEKVISIGKFTIAK